MINFDQLVYRYNLELARHHGEGAAVSLQSALQCGLWYNAIGCAELNAKNLYPEAVLTQWQGSDNHYNYMRHINDPRTREQLERYGWVDSTIEYHINSWGFRADYEYVNVKEPCLVVLGCSFTFGTGLHQHQTWARILANRLGLKLVNLGTPGHGLDLNSLWLLLEGHNILNPRAVCVLEPPMGRFSWLALINDRVTSADNLFGISANNKKILSTQLLNSTANSLKNYNIIKSWADSHRAAFVWEYNTGNPTDYARDLSHWGCSWHERKADAFYKQLKNS